MSDERDLYEILGVARDADGKAIKSAFRQLAKKFHPDSNADDPEAEQKFKEINAAYEILKDEDKRAAYDRYGFDAFRQGGPGAGGGFGGAGAGGFSDIFEDLFADFMGGGAQQRGGRGGNRATRGSDLRYNLEISLEEAFNGMQEEIEVTTSVTCDPCDGMGSANGAKPKTCPSCNGAGKVRAQQGFFMMERTCPRCAGTGEIITNPCKKCAGTGRSRKAKTLAVTIPKGVEEGTRIRLSGEGESGLRGGPAGDLYIFLSIEPHEFFKREGADIHCRIPIRMTTAALGGQIEVPVIDGGRARVTVPSGTQTSDKFRLRGKGMSMLRAGERRGDMYVHAQIETPVNLSKKQKELLEELDETCGNTPGTSPKSEGFFDKVKELWEGLTD